MKKLATLILSIALITVVISVFISSCAKVCNESTCENGYCFDGECECYSGYTGTRCETYVGSGGGGGGGSTAGYKCVSGSCTYVSSGAQYSTQSACQSSCGGGSSCNSTSYSGSQNCSTQGYVAVSSSACCPSTHPYHCPSTGYCYTSCDAAKSAGCGYIVYGTGQTGGGGGSSAGYSCSGGSCVYVSNGAQYSTQSACQSSCGGGGGGGGGGGSTSGYNCVSGNCNYVSSNAQYSTYAACTTNCAAPAPKTGSAKFWTSDTSIDPGGEYWWYVDGKLRNALFKSNIVFSSFPGCVMPYAAGLDVSVAHTYKIVFHKNNSPTNYTIYQGTFYVTDGGCTSVKMN